MVVYQDCKQQMSWTVLRGGIILDVGKAKGEFENVL